ncbi:MAG: cytochrome c, partial [Myxococcales bacterium]|nr:cytochrome c [Myxococcales bacterium]
AEPTSSTNASPSPCEPYAAATTPPASSPSQSAPRDPSAIQTQLDDAFHSDLVQLVRAAQQNDLELTTTRYAKVVEGCTNCHVQYRY